MDTELLKEFKEHKKEILDVRAKIVLGKQIDIEVQILPMGYMLERTMFYWCKMYIGQVKPGDIYDQLKRCITINIVNFKCIDFRKGIY